MNLQNWAILEFTLLKKKRICEVLNVSVDNCCICILNVLMPLQDQVNEINKVAKDSEAFVATLGSN